MNEQEFQTRAEQLADEILAANPSKIKMETATTENVRLELVESIKHQRRIYLGIIAEAEAELQHLQWHDVNVIMLNTIKGVRDKFLVRFGNFIKSKEDGWLLQPTNEKVMSEGMRFGSPKKAGKYATTLRRELKGETDKESDAMIQLKKEIQANLTCLKEAW